MGKSVEELRKGFTPAMKTFAYGEAAHTMENHYNKKPPYDSKKSIRERYPELTEDEAVQLWSDAMFSAR